MSNKEKAVPKSGIIKTKSKKKTSELGNLAIDIEKQKDFEHKVANLPSAEVSIKSSSVHMHFKITLYALTL